MFIKKKMMIIEKLYIHIDMKDEERMMMMIIVIVVTIIAVAIIGQNLQVQIIIDQSLLNIRKMRSKKVSSKFGVYEFLVF